MADSKRKWVIAAYFGFGLSLISLLHTWYASAAYEDGIRVGPTFFQGFSVSVPIRYGYILDVAVGIASLGLMYLLLLRLPRLSDLTLDDLRSKAPSAIIVSIVLVFISQAAGASWSKAALSFLVVLTGALVIFSYAYPLPAWEVAAVYLTIIFGSFTLGGEWLSYAETIQSQRFRPMTYFTVSTGYAVAASAVLLYQNVRPLSDTGTEEVSEIKKFVESSENANSLSSSVSDPVFQANEQYQGDILKQIETGEQYPYPDETVNIRDLLFSEHKNIRFERHSILTLSQDTVVGMDALRLLCSEAYRETIGESPKMVVIRDTEGLSDESLWQIENGIVCLQFGSGWEKLLSDDASSRRLWDKVHRFASDERSVVLMDTGSLPLPSEYQIPMDNFVDRGMSSKTVEEVFRLCCGYLPTDTEADPEQPHTDMDNIEHSEGKQSSSDPGTNVYPSRCRDLMLSRLRSLESESSGLYKDATSESVAHESSLHLLMKSFLVRWISETKEGESPSNIANRVRTNIPISEVIADVMCADGVFEVETFCRADMKADSVRNQLQHSFTKYHGTDIERVNVLLNPLTASRYTDEFVSVHRNHQKWCDETGIDVEFYVPNLTKAEPIPFSEFVSDISDKHTKNTP